MQDVQGLQKSTADFKEAVGSGGFRISEQGAERLQTVLLNMQQRLDDLRPRLAVLEQVPKLGSHSYGQLVAQHNHRTATGEPDSALTMVEQLQQVLEEALEALESAKKQYAEYEQSASGSVQPGVG